MRCSCCGDEIKETERYCNNCGQNNEAYVERQQPIERVEIYRRPQNNSASSQYAGANTYSQGQMPNGTYSQPGYNYQQTNYQQPNSYYQAPPPVTKTESSTIGILAIIFSVLGGWLGLILAIVGLCTYKLPENRSKCKIALGFVIGWFVLGILIGIAGAL